MVELSPCPFCNRQLEHYEAIGATRHPKIPYEEYCPLVGFLFASDRTDIIAAWNKRGAPAQQTRTCATCHAVLAEGPQPAATYSAPSAPESRMPSSAKSGWWTHDDGSAKCGLGNLYYFSPAGATPPPYKTQRHVSAVIDIASDGTLAGVELIEDMPPPPPALTATECGGIPCKP
jgi:hypothetical protein